MTASQVISIVDYGVCNLGSISNMLHKLGFETQLVATAEEVARARKLILPGVGAFAYGMAALTHRGLVPVLKAKALQDRIPVLGICLGMQLFGHGSEEGGAGGLGLIDGACVRFRFEPGVRWRVPHMGWNVIAKNHESPLVEGLGARPRFYFTHSYHFVCKESADVLATANHGVDFTAAIQRNNVYGVQFHPEKSHRFGMTLLKNFGAIPC